MDLTSVTQAVLGVAAAAIVPIGALLGQRLLNLAETRLHIDISAQNQVRIEAAVDSVTGILRAKLLAGTMTLKDVSLGNAHVDNAAIAALNIAETAANASGVTKEEIAQQIVGALGHALGNDPDVPSVASPVPVPPAAATSFITPVPSGSG